MCQVGHSLSNEVIAARNQQPQRPPRQPPKTRIELGVAALSAEVHAGNYSPFLIHEGNSLATISFSGHLL